MLKYGYRFRQTDFAIPKEMLEAIDELHKILPADNNIVEQKIVSFIEEKEKKA
jgi:hypothetical protein